MSRAPPGAPARAGSLLCAIALLLFPERVHGGRPMIADDAGVVGRGNLQIEAWLRLDEATLENWAVVGFGPLERLELSLGGLHGTTLSDARYGATSPLLQAKYLVFEPEPGGWPGLALAAGAIAPLSFGPFGDEVWKAYGYAAVTHALTRDEAALLQLNLGLNHSGFEDPEDTDLLWAAGAQLRVIGEFYCFGELFSGDPETADNDGAAHAGAKYLLSEFFHIDATFGTGVWGDPKLLPFVTAGVRWQASL